jgi:glycosyltransferase involved in cell wall biosynthesis
MLITYNHEKYIEQALDSVLMQETDFDFEINVIEDCSTDRTQEIIMRYVRQYPDIVKPFFNKKNIGFKVTQRNFYQGFRTLTGEYFAILEGDDYWTSPHKLQRQVDFLDANPDFAICAHNTIKAYDDGTIPHRFLYWGRRADATVKDVILLQAFFHTTGVLYRNVFNGVPPRHYRSKWSCDIYIMISHSAFGKVHHIDEDWAVYRAHAGGRFSGMRQMEGWLYNIDSLRRYNVWLGYRFMRNFAESISRYCEHVLKSRRQEGVGRLNAYQLAKIATLWAFYRSIFHLLGLPSAFMAAGYTAIYRAASVLLSLHLLPKRAASRIMAIRFPTRRTRLSELPSLPESARWDLIWGLNATIVEGQRLVSDHPVLQLTAVRARDRAAMDRHALSERISGLTRGATYTVSLEVKSVAGTNILLHLRDSVSPETGRPGHEGEARFDLTSSSVTMVTGLSSPRVAPDCNGWQRVSADITTDDGEIFVYLGLLSKINNVHAFSGDDHEQLLFRGIEISAHPATPR